MIATPFSNLMMMSVIQTVVLHNSGENTAHYAPVLLYMYMYTVGELLINSLLDQGEQCLPYKDRLVL